MRSVDSALELAQCRRFEVIEIHFQELVLAKAGLPQSSARHRSGSRGE